jgi:hypothetical protein
MTAAAARAVFAGRLSASGARREAAAFVDAVFPRLFAPLDGPDSRDLHDPDAAPSDRRRALLDVIASVLQEHRAAMRRLRGGALAVEEFARCVVGAYATTFAAHGTSAAVASSSLPLSTLLLQRPDDAPRASEHARLPLFAAHADALIDALEADAARADAGADAPGGSVADRAALHEFAIFLRAVGLAADPAVRAVWARAIEQRLLRRVEEACEPNDGPPRRHFAALHAWRRAVAEPFAVAVIGSPADALAGGGGSASATRGELEQWANHLRALTCSVLARRRLRDIWSTIVDFPESQPHVLDIADCIAQQPALLRDVALATRATIASRLQHAGASTPNVLFLLSQTCRALCVVRPGKAAGLALVRQVCASTVRHLQSRRDAVAAVVAAMTDTKGDESTAWARSAPARAPSGAASADSRAAAGDDDVDDGSGDATTAGGAGDGPDVLRMLLSVITVPVVVREHCRALAGRLLSARPASVDVDAEKEVLERLKALLGEDACANAAVMLRDFENSRRWWRATTAAAAAAAAAAARPDAPQHQHEQQQQQQQLATSTIVSAPCWPASVSDGPVAKLAVHPQLAAISADVAKAFHDWKQNQSLRLIPHHGFVTLSFAQRVPDSADAASTVRRAFRLSLTAASAALYLSEKQPRAVADVAALLSVSVTDLLLQLQDDTPRLFVLRGSGAGGASALTLELQAVAHRELGAGDNGNPDAAASDADAAARDDDPDNVVRAQLAAAPALPAGMTPAAVEMLQQMLRAMIGNTGPKTAAQVENAARIVGAFSGTSADMREVLSYFLQRGVLCTDGSGTYRLPSS